MPQTSLTEEKKILRARMRALRRSLTPTQAARMAEGAQKRLLGSTLWNGASSVALYVSLKDELDTAPLLDAAWAEGKTLFLPRVRQKAPGLMDFVAVRHRHQLRPGPFQLQEPQDDLPGFSAEEAGISFCPDIIIVPGVAFDRHGRRLGFGGGYYDRFLSGLRRPGSRPCALVGFCYACQLLDHDLPAQAWDQRMTHICTEEEWLCPQHP